MDYRFIERKPAFAQQTGLSSPRGRTVPELMPDIEPLWLENYEQVLRTDEPAHFERWPRHRRNHGAVWQGRLQ